VVRTPLPLPPQDLVLPPAARKEVLWPVDVPADVFSIAWEAACRRSRAVVAPRTG
jgi:hypothetical protein